MCGMRSGYGRAGRGFATVATGTFRIQERFCHHQAPDFSTGTGRVFNWFG
jgi:hypothetical protein